MSIGAKSNRSVQHSGIQHDGPEFKAINVLRTMYHDIPQSTKTMKYVHLRKPTIMYLCFPRMYYEILTTIYCKLR